MSEMNIDFSAFAPEALENIAAESAAANIDDTVELDVDGNPITPDLGGGDPPEPDPIDPKLDPNVDPDIDLDAPDPELDDDEVTKNTKLVYSKVANLLKEEGLFDDEIKLEDITSSDSLVEAMKTEIKRNEFADLSETQRKYLTAIREGVPANIFLQHEQVMQSYRAVTEVMVGEDEALRKEIILRDLTSKGVDEKRATRLYTSLVESGEDVEEAITSLVNLKEAEKVTYQAEVDKIAKGKEDIQKEQTKRFDRLKNSVFETQEIIKNYKITDKLRDEVYTTMTKPVSYSEDGLPINKLTSERDKDPIGFDTKLYYLFTMTKGFKDFSTFEKKAQSKAARQLERVVQENSNLLNLGSESNIRDDDQTDQPHFVELSDD